MKPRAFAVVLGACFQLGCGLLDTDHSDIIDPNDLNTAEGAQSKYLGAISNFTFAAGGDPDVTFGSDGFILLGGLLSDEFIHATTPPSEQEIDQRGATKLNPNIEAMYLALHRARVASEDAAARLALYSTDGDADPGIPEMLALSGFTYIYFAEGFCTAIPFSSVVSGKVIPGPQITRDSVLRTALTRLDSAITLAVADGLPNIEGLARVGKARALLNIDTSLVAMADIADTVVSPVPPGFAYLSEHSAASPRLENQILVFGRDGLWSVADVEGGSGLPYRTAADPRIPYDDTGDTGLDGITPLYSLLKYPDIEASVPVADGIEAQLIQAEDQLRNSQTGAMNATLNTIRAASALGLANLPAPATQAEAEDQLFSERAFWLFATGHRLGDMRRLVRQYGRSANSVFPTGAYHKQGSYSDQVSLLVPSSEDLNPKFNRAACDPTVP